jgi:hypothetical protein
MNVLSSRANNVMETNISDYSLTMNQFLKNSDYNLVNSQNC